MAEAYAWVWVYLAVGPRTGQGVVLSLPGLDGACCAAFPRAIAAAVGDQRVVVVLANAPGQTSRAAGGGR